MPQPKLHFRAFIANEEIETDEDGGISDEEIQSLVHQKLIVAGIDPSSDIKYSLKPGILVNILLIASPGEPGHSQYVDPVQKRAGLNLN
jgi:hypothetical protein